MEAVNREGGVTCDWKSLFFEPSWTSSVVAIRALLSVPLSWWAVSQLLIVMEVLSVPAIANDDGKFGSFSCLTGRSSTFIGRSGTAVAIPPAPDPRPSMFSIAHGGRCLSFECCMLSICYEECKHQFSLACEISRLRELIHHSACIVGGPRRSD
jgi:hypothetical protein